MQFHVRARMQNGDRQGGSRLHGEGGEDPSWAHRPLEPPTV